MISTQIMMLVRAIETSDGITPARSARYPHLVEYIRTVPHGTGAWKVDAAYTARLELTTPQTLDLRDTLVSLVSGDVVDFPIVMGIFVTNLSTQSGETVLIGGGSTPFHTWIGASGQQLPCGPEGFTHLWNPIDGYATTADTADLLLFTAVSGTPSVDVTILGRTL